MSAWFSNSVCMLMFYLRNLFSVIQVINSVLILNKFFCFICLFWLFVYYMVSALWPKHSNGETLFTVMLTCWTANNLAKTFYCWHSCIHTGDSAGIGGIEWELWPTLSIFFQVFVEQVLVEREIWLVFLALAHAGVYFALKT